MGHAGCKFSHYSQPFGRSDHHGYAQCSRFVTDAVRTCFSETEPSRVLHELAAEDVITLVVQVNGRLRDKLQVSVDISEEEARRLALESERVKVHVADKQVARVIYVPGRLVNVVTGR